MFEADLEGEAGQMERESEETIGRPDGSALVGAGDLFICR